MPVPRRFDRQPPERDTTRINERIRVPEVRLIDETGQQVGIMRTQEALRRAQDKDLDLVEVDERTESIGRKIREAELRKIPLMLVVGDREAETATVSVREHGAEEATGVPVHELARKVAEQTAARTG